MSYRLWEMVLKTCFSLSILVRKLCMQRSTSRPYATAMIVRQSLSDRQSTSRSHPYPQVTERRIAWVALAKRLVAQDEMLFSRGMRMFLIRCALAKRYAQDKMPVEMGYSCARRSRAACRSGVSNPSVNQAYTPLSCRLASTSRCCAIHNRARLIVARSSNDLACCDRAISIARRIAASPSDASAPCMSRNSPRRRCNSASHQHSLCARASASASSMDAKPSSARPAFP